MTEAATGPSFPNHDIAHYVIEKEFDIKEGFYGLIASGYTIHQLSETNTIRSLPRAVWLAEVLTRALQCVSSGACEIEQFEEMAIAELENMSMDGIEMPAMPLENIILMYEKFKRLLEQWVDLKEGDSLELDWL